MAKTANYTRKAIDNYRTKFDLAQIRLPKGTRDRAKANGINLNDVAVDAILKEIEKSEKNSWHVI